VAGASPSSPLVRRPEGRKKRKRKRRRGEERRRGEDPGCSETPHARGGREKRVEGTREGWRRDRRGRAAAFWGRARWSLFTASEPASG
jgi:hypothetical protein